jgi:hypothetical protein
MKPILVSISVLALSACLVSSVLCAMNGISPETNKNVLLAGTLVWFVFTPLWMGRKKRGIAK